MIRAGIAFPPPPVGPLVEASRPPTASFVEPMGDHLMNTRIIEAPQWTSETVARFWNHAAHSQASQMRSFSRQVGDAVVEFLEYSGLLPQGTRVLDFGCGAAFLAQPLLAAGAHYYGCDSSEHLVSLANSTYDGNSGWHGAVIAAGIPLPYENHSFDLVTCIEIIEHVTDQQLASIFSEIRRVLRPGGSALFTTPHNENLARGTAYCPFCDTEFHHRQHIRSFTSSALAAALAANGLRVVFCDAMSFRQFGRRLPGWRDWSPRIVAKALRYSLLYLKDHTGSSANVRYGPAFRHRAGCSPKAPHLCAIVTT